jgi:hypothetical protein
MFDHARQLLAVEVSEVTGRAVDEIDAEIETALGQSIERVEEG